MTFVVVKLAGEEETGLRPRGPCESTTIGKVMCWIPVSLTPVVRAGLERYVTSGVLTSCATGFPSAAVRLSAKRLRCRERA